MEQDSEVMTAQAVYDECVTKLMRQGRRSAVLLPDGGVSCRYRSDNGTACAAGLLLRDDEYRCDMERLTVGGLHVNRLLPMRLTPHVELLGDLQEVHDRGDDDSHAPRPGQDADLIARWPQLLRAVAAKHGLSTAALDEICPVAGE